MRSVLFFFALFWLAAVALARSGDPGSEGEVTDPAPASAQEDLRAHVDGLLLGEAIQLLQREAGLDIVYSEALVGPELRVSSRPTSPVPETMLRELLAPHGLTVTSGPGGRLVVTRATSGSIRGVVRDAHQERPIARAVIRGGGRQQVVAGADGSFLMAAVPPGSYLLEVSAAGYRTRSVPGLEVSLGLPTEVEIALELAMVAIEEIVVTPSRVAVARDDPASPLTIDADQVRELPEVSGDFVRAVASLPGVASSDFSARVNLRGGRSDEVLILLDGMELLKPYHLEDLESALSVVAPETVGKLQLISGGLSAEYGDRMSGVLEMRTARPAARRSLFLGVAISDLSLAVGGRSGAGSTQWLASARRGNFDLASEAAGAKEKPAFWDAFGKLVHDISPRQTLTGEFLRSRDGFTLRGIDDGSDETSLSEYSNTYSWFTLQSTPSPRWTLESTVAFSHLEQDRKSTDSNLARAHDIRDSRILDLAEIRHRADLSATVDHLLRFGAGWRSSDASYDYHEQSPSASVPAAGREVVDTFTGRQLSGFASSRRRFRSLTFEIGVRFDENEIVDDSHLSPRLNIVWTPAGRNTFRLAAGAYHQSQRANELRVGDGEAAFGLDESSTQWVLGYDTTVGSGLQLRAEAYLRRIDEPRSRYENLLDPVSRRPEVEIDRVLLEPSESESYGLELLLRQTTSRIDWWASYTYSSVEDLLDQGWVPRSFDQPHALSLNATSRLGERWLVSARGEARSGWPTTPFELSALQTERGPRLELFFGPLASERLADYLRLDLRLARSWTLRRSEMQLWLSLFNTTNQGNPRGFELSLPSAAPAGAEPSVRPVEWLSRVASAGVSWRF